MFVGSVVDSVFFVPKSRNIKELSKEWVGEKLSQNRQKRVCFMFEKETNDGKRKKREFWRRKKWDIRQIRNGFSLFGVKIVGISLGGVLF